MFDRVRAILITTSNRIVLIKRIREGLDPYWVAPGGGIEETDKDDETALLRELTEELGAEVDILKLVYLSEQQNNNNQTTTAIYLCRLKDIDLSRRTGPEFSTPSRGEYIIDEVPLDGEILANLNILPTDLKSFVCENAQHMFALPDLRQTPALKNHPNG